MLTQRARLIAFYLPQFHPIPENDAWWGKGFTEWTNVVQARPLFPGHYQPHLPADLGFYDLRLPVVRKAQADLAARHGIEGFCYWHYWFNGRQLLERPFNEVLASGEPDFPFCLAWANETWSRRWLGEEKDILLQQTYSAADDVCHARWLTKAFADRRYLRVEGRPLFLVYRPRDLPDARATTAAIRTECTRAGLPNPYLVGIAAHNPTDYRPLGFDANLEFEPQLGWLPETLQEGLQVYDYVAARRRMIHGRGGYPSYPCIVVSWDNTPRRGEQGITLINATPENFEDGLCDMVASVQGRPIEHRLVFLNAWNEWAEGNHLEPDLKHGLRYLEAVRQARLGKEPVPQVVPEPQQGIFYRHQEVRS
jgi:lipopolysaccharide biosynthesis protein